MRDSSDGLALGGLKSYLAFGNNFELDFTHECARSAQEKNPKQRLGRKRLRFLKRGIAPAW